MLLTEKGNPFLLGANRTAEGYNFALDVPEGETVKLLLYKKGGKTPKYILPFPEEEKMGRGANRTAEGYNFALDVPEGETVKLLLYKKGGKTPKYILPFPEEEKMGRICAMEVKGISGEAYEYNYMNIIMRLTEKYIRILLPTVSEEKSISGRGQKMCTKCAADFFRKKNIPGRAINRREFPMKIWYFISSM